MWGESYTRFSHSVLYIVRVKASYPADYFPPALRACGKTKSKITTSPMCLNQDLIKCAFFEGATS